MASVAATATATAIGWAGIRWRGRARAALFAVLLIPGAAFAGTASEVLLNADFQDQPLDQPIGIGGAGLGQPIEVFPLLDAVVRDTPMASRSLAIGWIGAAATASMVSFELLDGVEIAGGELVIEMDLHPHVASSYQVALREAGSAVRRFGGLRLMPGGALVLEDAAGQVTVADALPIGQTFSARWLYDLDARSYDFWLDGEQVVSARGHGVPDDGSGIGSVKVGLAWNTPADTVLSLDNLRVRRFSEAIFAHGFEPRDVLADPAGPIR